MIVVIDSVFCWEGSRQSNVSISDVYTFIKEVHKTMPIEKASADQRYSAETLQKLRMDGIKTETFSFANRQQLNMYGTLKELLEEERIILPVGGRWRPLLEREFSNSQLDSRKKVMENIDYPP